MGRKLHTGGSLGGGPTRAQADTKPLFATLVASGEGLTATCGVCGRWLPVCLGLFPAPSLGILYFSKLNKQLALFSEPPGGFDWKWGSQGWNPSWGSLVFSCGHPPRNIPSNGTFPVPTLFVTCQEGGTVKWIISSQENNNFQIFSWVAFGSFLLLKGLITAGPLDTKKEKATPTPLSL